MADGAAVIDDLAANTPTLVEVAAMRNHLDRQHRKGLHCRRVLRQMPFLDNERGHKPALSERMVSEPAPNPTEGPAGRAGKPGLVFW